MISVHQVAWSPLWDLTGAFMLIIDLLGSWLGIPWSAEVENNNQQHVCDADDDDADDDDVNDDDDDDDDDDNSNKITTQQ